MEAQGGGIRRRREGGGGQKKKGEEMEKSGRGNKGIEGRRAVCRSGAQRDRLVYDGEGGGTAHFLSGFLSY